VLFILQQLAPEPPLAEQIVAAGFIPRAVEILQRLPRNEESCRSTCSIFHRILQHDDDDGYAKELIKFSAVPALVALLLHVADPKWRSTPSSSSSSLSSSWSSLPLSSLSSSHRARDDVDDHCDLAHAVGNSLSAIVTYKEDVRLEIAEHPGAVQALSDMLVGSTSQRCVSVHLMWNMSIHHGVARIFHLHPTILTTLVNILKRKKNHNSMKENAAAVLWNMAIDVEYKGKMLAKGILDPIMSLFLAHSPLAVERASGCLMNLMKENHNNTTAVAAHIRRLFPRMLQVFDARLDYSFITRRHCIGSLRYLAEIPSAKAYLLTLDTLLGTVVQFRKDVLDGYYEEEDDDGSDDVSPAEDSAEVEDCDVLVEVLKDDVEILDDDAVVCEETPASSFSSSSSSSSGKQSASSNSKRGKNPKKKK